MTSYYLQFLPVLAAALIFLVIGAVCFAGSQRAFEHSRKNLSWIKRHGAGGYPFARNAFPNRSADWLGVFGAAVFSLVVSMVYYALRSLADGANWLSGLFSAWSLISVVVNVAGVVALYFLLQRLFGSTLISASGSLLFAASFVGAHTAASLLAIALLMLVLWLNARQERLFPAELLYYAALLFLAAAISLRAQLLPFVLLFAGLHLYKHIFYLREDMETPGMFALAIGLGILCWLLGVCAFIFCRVLLYYGFTFGFLQDYVFPDFVGAAGKLLRSALHSLTAPLTRGRVLLPMLDAPLLGLGGFGLISALLLWLRRRDPRAVLVLMTAFFAVLVWLLSDCSVLSLAFSLSAGLLFSNYERGGKRAPVICVSILGILYYLVLIVLVFFIPLAGGIVSRLS